MTTTATWMIHELPAEIHQLVSTFCTSRDAVSLSRTCSSFHDALWISKATWMLDDKPKHWVGPHNQDPPRLIQEVSILFPPTMIQSVRVCCMWRDQGWGNRKSRLFVSTNSDQLSHDSIVVQSDIAEHDERPLELEFKTKADVKYYVWCRVGGGGGHQLFVRELRVEYVLWDLPNLHFARTLSILVQEGTTENLFGVKSVAVMASTLLGEEELPSSTETSTSMSTSIVHSPLRSYMEEMGIDVNRESLSALLEISTSQSLHDAILFQREKVPTKVPTPGLRYGGLDDDDFDLDSDEEDFDY
eukprot:CAMPEP_0116555152 /NCGR_PEP_ID=MMETSP0397-20121206/7996_1 /TAXON_ID=216820 /ORGANISM="Cyclophora tenuis, Strain ECT3854" /LENGTH=300 /DNA_ID=CAMNT_0004080407 /DNA_START=72 /DNA_END=974 /DNA_ORIENTATION=+